MTRPSTWKPALRLALTALALLLSTSCTSVLTTWHDQAYTPVVDVADPLVVPADSTRDLEQVPDLDEAAHELYAQGYVLVGYARFTHTLVPNFQAMYAKMYAERIGAERVVQAEPQQDGRVYAYTVTYWAKGRGFPFGAYTNDVPDETALYFPDSLRAAVGEGDRPVLVEEVVYGSPAEAAGIRDGELIVAVDGESFPGCDALDAIVAHRAGQEVTLTVWGLEGLRETSCTFGERLVNAEGFGPEGLYYNQPWAFDEYRNFQQHSFAFEQAYADGVAAYQTEQQRQVDQVRVDALNAQVVSLNRRIGDLERQPAVRSSRTSREDLIAQLRQDGARNWDDFKQRMDWD